MYTATRTIDVETYPDAAEPMDNADSITIGADALDIARHDAVITLVSPKTGDHRTFRIRTKKRGNLAGKRIVELLVGPSNTDDYQGFAFVNEAGRVNVWTKHRGADGSKSIYEKYADLLERPAVWSAKGFEYMASLKCRRCGRPLTHPESIATGLGPICASRD